MRPVHTELAPDDCVVCGNPRPAIDTGDWTYLAGVRPLGAMTCSEACLKIATRRHARGERVDGKR